MRRFFLLAAVALVSLAGGCGARNERAYLQFDGARAFDQVETQVSFGPRVPGSPEHAACAAYLMDNLSHSADSVWAERWTHVTAQGDTLPLVNIHASFNPRAVSRVLLCAHWDSRPRADQDPDPAARDRAIPGANDGASGVAVLIELARTFAHARPQAGVDLVLFDGEVYGDFYADTDVLLGSRHFAETHSGYRPAHGVLLDMVGDREARFPWEGNSWAALPQDCRLVWDTAGELGYGVYFPRQIGPAVIDDHIPLLKAGIRCLDLIQMGLPYWHTLQDTPGKLSPATLEAVGRTLAAVVYGLYPVR